MEELCIVTHIEQRMGHQRREKEKEVKKAHCQVIETDRHRKPLASPTGNEEINKPPYRNG
jgi:hypothetical protein